MERKPQSDQKIHIRADWCNKYRDNPDFDEAGIVKGADSDIFAITATLLVGLVGAIAFFVLWLFN